MSFYESPLVCLLIATRLGGNIGYQVGHRPIPLSEILVSYSLDIFPRHLVDGFDGSKEVPPISGQDFVVG